MRGLISGTVLAALAVIGSTQLQAGETMKTGRKPYNVTILVFDPTKGMESGQDYVLPVDSPDEEHAIASTTANAASFTTKVGGGKPLPVAFTCVKVEPRP